MGIVLFGTSAKELMFERPHALEAQATEKGNVQSSSSVICVALSLNSERCLCHFSGEGVLSMTMENLCLWGTEHMEEEIVVSRLGDQEKQPEVKLHGLFLMPPASKMAPYC